MGRQDETGNPVFDFQAGRRRLAAAVQRWLFRMGLAVAACGGLAWAIGRVGWLTRASSGYAVLAGLAFCLLGVAWGFFWRRRLRTAFRRAYGPQ